MLSSERRAPVLRGGGGGCQGPQCGAVRPFQWAPCWCPFPAFVRPSAGGTRRGGRSARASRPASGGADVPSPLRPCPAACARPWRLAHRAAAPPGGWRPPPRQTPRTSRATCCPPGRAGSGATQPAAVPSGLPPPAGQPMRRLGGRTADARARRDWCTLSLWRAATTLQGGLVLRQQCEGRGGHPPNSPCGPRAPTKGRTSGSPAAHASPGRPGDAAAFDIAVRTHSQGPPGRARKGGR